MTLNNIPVPQLLLSMFPEWANTGVRITVAASLFRQILSELQYTCPEVDGAILLYVARTVGGHPGYSHANQNERFKIFNKINNPRMGWKDFFFLSVEVFDFKHLNLTVTAELQAPRRFRSQHTVAHFQD